MNGESTMDHQRTIKETTIPSKAEHLTQIHHGPMRLIVFTALDSVSKNVFLNNGQTIKGNAAAGRQRGPVVRWDAFHIRTTV
jgi:hypothetical protein